jgi:hypothetical protein
MRRNLLLLAPLVIAGCGGGSTHAVSSDPLPAAADATSKQPSEKVSMQVKIDLSGQSLSLEGSGAFAQKKGELHLLFTAGVLGSSNLDELFEDDVVWLRSPLLSSSLHGKHWLKLDLAKRNKVLGFDLRALTGQMPSAALAKLRLSGSVSTLGHEKIGGVETTHYRKTLNVEDAGALYKSVDAWVDSENLVRQETLDYGARIDPTSVERAHTVLTMVFSDFGTAVSVTPPPASDVVDARELGGK